MIELLTGNMQLGASPLPLVILLLANYGASALLARELAARWRGGLASLLVMGIVYGIINEALTSGGFFNPRYYSVLDMGLENYGRWAGINVLWALGLIGVHAIWSIAAPVTLIDSLFPRNAGAPLLRRWGAVTSLVLLALSIAGVRAIAMFHLHEPPIEPKALLIVLIAMALLIVLSRRLAGSRTNGREHSFPRRLGLVVLGLIGILAWFFTFLVLRHPLPLPAVNCFALCGLMSLYLWCLQSRTELPLRSRLALATGAYGLLLFSALRSGIIIPAAVMTILLGLAWIKAAQSS